MPPMLTRLFCANDKLGIIKNEVKNINLKLITIDVKIQSSNGRFASAAALSSQLESQVSFQSTLTEKVSPQSVIKLSKTQKVSD